MAWHITGAKPLPAPLLTRIYATLGGEELMDIVFPPCDQNLDDDIVV